MAWSGIRLENISTGTPVLDKLWNGLVIWLVHCRYDLFKITWTDDEKRVFKEKFVQYGKNFAAISLFLEKKVC